jgi:murein DD-endopeptidase MepM/ murein hydrolase activator NlpD
VCLSVKRKRRTDQLKLRVLLFVMVLFLSGRWPAFAEDFFRATTLPSVVKQGEACGIRASGPASIQSVYGEFQGRRSPMILEAQSGTYVGLLGIDMDTRPGKYEIRVVATDKAGGVYSKALLLEVKKVDFGTQTLSLPASMVDLDSKTLERVEKEAERLEVLFQGFRDERVWSGSFLSPVQGEVATVFGVHRIINGQPRGPHTGVDLQAEEGTPVLASNSGIVVLVDELFFAGNSVILDHGWGIYSMYFHLSEVLVSEGNRVSKGAVLGRVGSTGRSSGPHLHWGIRMNGARVDPLSLLKFSERLRQ